MNPNFCNSKNSNKFSESYMNQLSENPLLRSNAANSKFSNRQNFKTQNLSEVVHFAVML